MSNPFAQGGDGDPFGELAASSGRQQQASSQQEFRPTRRAPPKPVSNPFAQPPAAAAAAAEDDPFDLLAATGTQGVSSAQQQLPAALPPPAQQQQQSAWDDDVFGIFSSAQPPAVAAATQSNRNSSPAAATTLPRPPAYAAAADLPPPAYGAADSCPPPPPAYAQALDLPPPSYEAVMGVQEQQQQQQQLRPARAAPTAPGAAVGPLTAACPSRPAPAAPAGASLAPARAPPAAPGAGAAPMPARPAPRAPPAAATGASAGGHQAAAAGMSELSLTAPQPGRSSGGQCAAATTGNAGLAPKGSTFGGQQVHQQELGAQIRLPPLNPKATAPLKHLAAGMGSLFAGPVDDASLLLQWSPSSTGSTLPIGGSAHRSEDHDSAAAAALGSGGQLGSAGSSKCRVSCMLFGAVPGRLWAGCADGKVFCWEAAGDGSVARLLHSWEAHSGKVKGLALSPSGRLFTGSSSGAVKMWSYGSPAFTDSNAPRLLRQLKKIDPRSGVGGNPHSKVVGLAVSAGGRVLWSVGKATVSLWSTHNGEHLGSLSESGLSDTLSNPFAAPGGAAAGPYGSPYTAQLQGAAAAAVGGGGGIGAAAGDINPRQGLDAGLLDTLFARPSAELLAEEDAFDSEKDAASVAYNAAVKGAAKAGKLFNKLTKMAAAKLKEEGKLGLREDSTDSDHRVGSFSAGAGAADSSAADESGLEGKVGRWGSIKKLAAAADGSVWLSYKRGLLEHHSEGGRLLWSSSGSSSSSSANSTAAGGSFKPAGITALAAVGSSIWVGDQQGRVWVLDGSSGALQRTWAAHVFPVRSIAAGGHLVYSLAMDGGIRAWPALAPPPELTAARRADALDCLQQQTLQVLACTWNVNETKPSRPGLELWLGERVKDAQLVLVGLQEVEMGTGSVALDVVYQQLAKAKLEAGTQAAQAWAAAISDVLSAKGRWKRVALRQMSGILALVFARAELEPHIGEVCTASVACGVMGYGGNKGAAAVSFSLFRRRVVLVSSHFAAHQDKVEARNADYAKIVRHLHFHNVPTDKPQQQSQYDAADAVVLPSSSKQFDAYGTGGSSGSPTRSRQQQQYNQQQYGAAVAGSGGGGSSSDEDWGAGMKDAEFLVWLGDFNYRVDLPQGFVPDRSNPERPVNEQLYQFVLQKIAARHHTELLTGDQCGREMARGSIFHGLAEGPIRFLPTYKFEKNRESSAMQPFYDQGEKMRVPAWTDRVLFRGAAPQRAALQPNTVESAADVRVSLAHPGGYSAVLDVNDSDHKPVYAQLALLLPWYQQQQLRSISLSWLSQVAQLAGSKLSVAGRGGGHSAAAAGDGCVVLVVEPRQLVLAGSHVPGEVLVLNPLQQAAVAFSVCAGVSGVPSWLEVVPVSGVLPPGGGMSLRVQGSKGCSWGRVGGGQGCELRVAGCVEGSIDSSSWPLASVGSAAAVSVVLH